MTDLSAEETKEDRRRSVKRWLLPAGIGLGILVLAFVGWTILHRDSTSVRYLHALEDANVRDDFAADRAAIRNATKLCADLDDGAKPNGTEADLIGVEYYCDEYAKGFHVVETLTVNGTLELSDYDSYASGHSSCQGVGGYRDIAEGTSVIVRNGDGTVLGRSRLEAGRPSTFGVCEFAFDVDLTEGEDEYLVEVSHRGEISYEWNSIRSRGIGLTLG